MAITYWIINLLLPVLMIAVRFHWKEHYPKEINGIYGYRTKRSMQSKTTWKFAHSYMARLWRWTGTLLIILTGAVFMLFWKFK